MRIDTAGARTWLIAAVALWAVCTWALAAFGFGGRVQPLPEDPALLQPLPQAGEAVDERLGPLAQYGEIVERPLFAEDRRHRPFFIQGQDDEEAGPVDFDVVLTSVLITPRLEMAIVQPREGDGEAMRFRIGESAHQAPGWTLTSVAPRSATFAGPDGERVLELRVFDGIGGEPPTASADDAAASTQDRSAAQDGSEPEPARRRTPLGSSDGRVAETAAPAEEETRAEQAEAIRSRIEARRARLREQQPQPQPPAAAQQNQ